jgi:hypothetical protein
MPYFLPENKFVLTHTLKRCGNCIVLNAALAVYDEVGVVKHTSAEG